MACPRHPPREAAPRWCRPPREGLDERGGDHRGQGDGATQDGGALSAGYLNGPLDADLLRPVHARRAVPVELSGQTAADGGHQWCNAQFQADGEHYVLGHDHVPGGVGGQGGHLPLTVAPQDGAGDHQRARVHLFVRALDERRQGALDWTALQQSQVSGERVEDQLVLHKKGPWATSTRLVPQCASLVSACAAPPAPAARE